MAMSTVVPTPQRPGARMACLAAAVETTNGGPFAVMACGAASLSVATQAASRSISAPDSALLLRWTEGPAEFVDRGAAQPGLQADEAREGPLRTCINRRGPNFLLVLSLSEGFAAEVQVVGRTMVVLSDNSKGTRCCTW